MQQVLLKATLMVVKAVVLALAVLGILPTLLVTAELELQEVEEYFPAMVVLEVGFLALVALLAMLEEVQVIMFTVPAVAVAGVHLVADLPI
jgi:hypothetical protein